MLPDGSILRAKLPGRPTRDCLFSDPARDGKRYYAKKLVWIFGFESLGKDMFAYSVIVVLIVCLKSGI